MDPGIQSEDTARYLQEVGREVGSFVQRLLSAGDRAAVVLGAARLDVALENALRALMSAHPNGQDNLFDNDRPLGSLSAKIALAHRLGIIDQDVEHSLQLIRKIRNDFAHSIDDESLTVQRHRNRLSASVARAREHVVWKGVRPLLDKAEVPDQLRDFCVLLVTVVALLEVFANVQRRVSVIPLVRFSGLPPNIALNPPGADASAG